MPSMLLSGLMLPMTLAPGWLDVLSHFMPFRYLVDAVRDAYVGAYATTAMLYGVLVAVALRGARRDGRHTGRSGGPERNYAGRMVNLTRIYTRTGDQGTTALGDMSRTAKTDLRIAAYADANEANAVIGTAIALGQLAEEVVKVLVRVQNDLFDVGADLSHAGGREPGVPAAAGRAVLHRQAGGGLRPLPTRSWRSCAASSCPAAPRARPCCTRRARSSAAPSARPGRRWRCTARR